MKKLLPIILAILGLGAGAAGGMFLKPVPEQPTTDETIEKQEDDETLRRSEQSPTDEDLAYEYVKMNNQFVVPVVHGAKVTALIVMSLSIEIASGNKETVFEVEPKLRDSFLQVMFNHANAGGFDGVFTEGEKMSDLRGSLFEAAREILGEVATDILIFDIVRQDI